MKHLLLILLLIPGLAVAGADPVYTGFFSSVAAGGYDPVAYFDQNKPVEGDSRFTYRFKEAEFRFSSADNLAKFSAAPAAYAPQYGGYCAWAVSQGKLAKGDPKYWRIVAGKLYLNYDREVQERWEKDIPGFIQAADRNWPGVLD